MYISRDEYNRLVRAEKERQALHDMCRRFDDCTANMQRANENFKTALDNISKIIKEN